MNEHSTGRGDWIVSRRGSSGVEETQFALADGVLGVRATLEELRSGTSGAYMASVFEQTPIHYHERLPGFAESSDTRVPIVDGMRLRVVAQGEVLGGAGTSLESCDWQLDLAGGTVRRTSVWSTSHGRIEIHADRVMPGRPGASIALRYVIRSVDFSGEVEVTSLLDVTSRNLAEGDDPRIGVNLAGGGLRLVERGASAGVSFCIQRTSRSQIWVAAAQAHLMDDTARRVVDASIAGEAGVAAAPGDRFLWSLDAGSSLSLQKYVVYACGEGTPADEAIQELCERAQSMRRESFDEHVRRRKDDLDAQWRTSDVHIGGDAACDRALRFNTFHLLQSASLDPRYSTAAKGLTGEGYEGHAFWDTEAFVVPALVFTAPQLARTALEARISQLDGARATARTLNHRRGALFPWRTIAGRECSAHYPSGSAQYHINAAIAQAVELYVTTTGDETLLLDGGAELLWETARVWIDVGTYSSAHGGKFCIFGVTGPDEYSALVDNNYYTNRMAALHLRYAAHVFHDLASRYPGVWAELTSRLQVGKDEVAAWVAASDAMYLPYDSILDIDAQDERFLAKPRLDLSSTGTSPLLLNMHPLTLYRHQVSKQADLVLAMVFAGQGIPRDRLRRNLAYYETVTTHDSTLSACAYAIVAAIAGLPEKALEYFRRAVFVDIEDLHGNVSHGSHMASLAGSVMTVHWGFAGITWRGGKLGFRPVLPSSWSSVRFRMLWRGRLIEVEFDHSRATYRLIQGEPLDICHCGATFTLATETEFRRSSEQDCVP